MPSLFCALQRRWEHKMMDQEKVEANLNNHKSKLIQKQSWGRQPTLTNHTNLKLLIWRPQVNPLYEMPTMKPWHSNHEKLWWMDGYSNLVNQATIHSLSVLRFYNPKWCLNYFRLCNLKRVQIVLKLVFLEVWHFLD